MRAWTGSIGPCGLLLAVLAGCGAPASDRPNVLLITIDTVRADHLSAYGYERATTPTLERLASEGVLFENAYAPMATTLPSHVTIFTGLYPRSHGVLKNGHRLGDGVPTLAEALSESGYATAAVVSSFPVHGRFGVSRGFDSYDDAFENGGGESGKAHAHEDGTLEYDRDAALTTARASVWLRDRGASAEPFLLWVHYFDPHAPYAPPERFARFDGGEDELARTVAAYDGEILETDDAIGDLLAALEAGGHAESTLVVVTGDHGEGLMQHGWMAHGLHLYEETVRVPLIMRWPGGLPAGHRIDAPVQLVDLMPTLLELTGAKRAPRPGVSLVAAARDGESLDPRRPVYLERRHYDSNRVGDVEIAGSMYGLRVGSWKYIEAPVERTYELFDLADDPGETRNLFDVRRDEARRLAAMLHRWRGTEAGGPERQAPVSVEELEGLRSLGYVQ